MFNNITLMNKLIFLNSLKICDFKSFVNNNNGLFYCGIILY